MTVNSSVNCVILIVFALSDNLSAENSSCLRSSATAKTTFLDVWTRSEVYGTTCFSKKVKKNSTDKRDQQGWFKVDTVDTPWIHACIRRDIIEISSQKTWNLEIKVSHAVVKYNIYGPFFHDRSPRSAQSPSWSSSSSCSSLWSPLSLGLDKQVEQRRLWAEELAIVDGQIQGLEMELRQQARWQFLFLVLYLTTDQIADNAGEWVSIWATFNCSDGRFARNRNRVKFFDKERKCWTFVLTFYEGVNSRTFREKSKAKGREHLTLLKNYLWVQNRFQNRLPCYIGSCLN